MNDSSYSTQRKAEARKKLGELISIRNRIRSKVLQIPLSNKIRDIWRGHTGMISNIKMYGIETSLGVACSGIESALIWVQQLDKDLKERWNEIIHSSRQNPG